MRRALPVALLALVLAGAGCTGDDSASTTTTSVVGTTTTASTTVTTTLSPTTTTTTTTPAAALGDLVWSRVDDEAAFRGPHALGMMKVTAWGSGLLALGASGQSEYPVVWLSSDGYDWTRIQTTEETFGGSRHHAITAMTAVGPGVVAAGWTGPRRAGQGRQGDAAVWVSEDGYTWSFLDDWAVFGGPGRQRINGVTASGPGLVAVGYEKHAGKRAAVWVSADGMTWSRVSDDSPPFSEESHTLVMWSVTTGGPGLVAVGSDEPWENGDNGSDAAVWVSEDGYDWTRVPDSDAAFGGPRDQVMRTVTAGGPGLVATGSDEYSTAVWVSADGYHWEKQVVFPADGPGGTWIAEVVAAGSGLVAVGEAPKTSVLDRVAAAWFSEDGYTWIRYPESAFPTIGTCPTPRDEPWCYTSIGGIAVGGPGLVVVGADPSREGATEAAVWVATAPDQ